MYSNYEKVKPVTAFVKNTVQFPLNFVQCSLSARGVGS